MLAGAVGGGIKAVSALAVSYTTPLVYILTSPSDAFPSPLETSFAGLHVPEGPVDSDDSEGSIKESRRSSFLVELAEALLFGGSPAISASSSMASTADCAILDAYGMEDAVTQGRHSWVGSHSDGVEHEVKDKRRRRDIRASCVNERLYTVTRRHIVNSERVKCSAKVRVMFNWYIRSQSHGVVMTTMVTWSIECLL